jgi:hypothetical protein
LAKVTVTIEDAPNGRVKIVSTPDFDSMCKMENSGNSLTQAESYAFRCLYAIYQFAKEDQATGSNVIKIPKVKLI